MLVFLTPDVWNALIVLTIVIGGALALWRLWQDLTRPTLSDDDARRDVGGPESEKRA
ncbi:MAG: hypothetical protein Kow00120_06040 [Anaerolineae bacterium]